jgi:hypothetical protein
VDGNPDAHGAGNDKVIFNGIHNQWAQERGPSS